jgi:hypothetical protein
VIEGFGWTIGLGTSKLGLVNSSTLRFESKKFGEEFKEHLGLWIVLKFVMLHVYSEIFFSPNSVSLVLLLDSRVGLWSLGKAVF